MRFLWLFVLVVGVAGIVVYIVADYDYSNFVDKRGSSNLIGLQGWVSFYQDVGIILLVAPILLVIVGLRGIGIVGLVRKVLELLVGRTPTVFRQNSIATIAVTLSVINFGLLMWQIWPEPSPSTFRPGSFNNGGQESRISQLELQISSQRYDIEQLQWSVR